MKNAGRAPLASTFVVPLVLSALPLVDESDERSATASAEVRQDADSALSLGAAPDQAATFEAIERGLTYLRERQKTTPDGSLPTGSSRSSAPVAVSALGALAFMAAGNTPDRGPHGVALTQLIDYLLSKTDTASDSNTIGYVADDGDAWSRMHGHGFATLAFAQAWSISPSTARGKRLEAALKLATHRIEVSQHIDGGWNYEPNAGITHEGSVTIAVVQALRAARNVGVRVDTEVIAKAVDYVARSQKDDGSFAYKIGDDRSSVALTAAAISTLNATGDYSSKPIQAGYDYIFRSLEDRTSEIGLEATHPYYERIYLAQAFWQHADERVFERWVAEERRRVIAAQRENGSWSDRTYGDCYATAMNCLFLALPDGLLPIFQR